MQQGKSGSSLYPQSLQGSRSHQDSSGTVYKKVGFFFSPQDYLKILLCGLTNFHINAASDLQSLLLKLRDPNKLVHFALRYPSFKQSVFYKPIMDQVKNFMHLTKLKRFYCSFPLRFYLSTVSTFRVSCIKSFPLEGTISFWSAIWLSFIIQSENVHTRNSILKQIRSLIFLLFGVLIINIIGSVIEIHFQFHRVPDWSLMDCFWFCLVSLVVSTGYGFLHLKMKQIAGNTLITLFSSSHIPFSLTDNVFK